MRKQRHALTDAAQCPMEIALDFVGGKWKGVIRFRLAEGPMRFNTLHRAICRITARSSTQALRDLEADEWSAAPFTPKSLHAWTIL